VLVLVTASSPAITPMSQASAQCIGPGDADANQIVDLSDFATLSGCLNGPGAALSNGVCEPQAASVFDTDDDGDIDLRDYSRFATAFMMEYFNYGPHRENPEAERLAIQLSGELRAPDEVYERVLRDLALLRELYSDLQGASDTREYVGDELLVHLVSPNNRGMFDTLNAYFLIVSDYEYHIVPGLHLLQFCDNLNAPVLVAEYEALDEVQNAEPDWVDCTFGCARSQIEVSRSMTNYRYTFNYDAQNPADPNSACWRVRVLETDGVGQVLQVSCTDSCLGECP
jgi:hypothetical protein